MDQYELTIVKDVYPEPEEMCKPSQNGMALHKAKTSKSEVNEVTTNFVQRDLTATGMRFGLLSLVAQQTIVLSDTLHPKK
jgi:hypothetical protein